MKLIAIAAAVCAAVALPACGDDEGSAEPPPTGPFAQALAATAGGGAGGSLGFAWADRELVEAAGYGDELIARVLPPNADTVVEAAPVLRRRFGFDPLAADRYVAVGGSYAFGLRLDGVGEDGLARALVAAGGKARSDGPLEVIEIGAYAVVPEPLLDAGVNGLGAYDVFGPDLAVLAIADRAADALLGDGERLLDEPVYAAAADCLGDVAAARMVPDKQLLSIEVGIELAAIGIGRDREVLCILGGTSERADEVAANLEATLDPGARDPVTGDPLADAVASVEVERDEAFGVAVVRAELEPTAGAKPGWLLGTISRGSLVSLINGDDESFLP